VDGAGLQPGNNAKGLLRDLVVRGTGLGRLESTAPDDVIPSPESLGATGLGAAELLLLGSPDFLSPPIN
jgi:hypothetical protein